MTRRYDPRRAKRHRSYSAYELCDALNVSIGTIRAWKSAGLQPIDDRRPHFFSGSEVQRFLIAHNKPKRPLDPGEIYCVACKTAIRPAGGLVELVPLSPTTGDLIGTCPLCRRKAYRRVRLPEATEKAGALTIRYEGGSAPLVGASEPPHTEPSEEIAA